MSVQASIAAWEQSLGAVIELGAGLDGPQWLAPTECPAWTVKDVYAHLVGGEAWVNAGRPLLPDLDSFADAPVRARREVDGPTVLAQLRTEYERRRAALSAGRPDPDQAALSPFGTPTTVGFLLRLRAFDVWVHEQDIRRALHHPGNLDSAAARIAADLIRGSLPHTVAVRAGALPGTRVRISVTGALPFEMCVVVDGEGRATLGPPEGPATAHLRIDWEALARVTAGRIAVSATGVVVTGDRRLADRILAVTITP